MYPRSWSWGPSRMSIPQSHGQTTRRAATQLRSPPIGSCNVETCNVLKPSVRYRCMFRGRVSKNKSSSGDTDRALWPLPPGPLHYKLHSCSCTQHSSRGSATHLDSFCGPESWPRLSTQTCLRARSCRSQPSVVPHPVVWQHSFNPALTLPQP